VDPEDQEKTTFTCPFGTFAYRRMPFGLCNAPITFQRCMISIFSDMVDCFLEVFMDNFSVFGSSFEECLHHLTLVLVRCKEKNLILNWEKCHFMVQQGIVLGHAISPRGIEVDKAKVDLISNLPPPRTVKEVRSFLDGYYYFLDGYSGYNHVPVDPEDQEKTTFTCPFGTFAYRRMPFGLCNAPTTFQRCMISIFSDMVERFLEVFMDNFSVFGSSFEECLHHLTLVLVRCKEKNLILNWEKCHFMVQQGIVLGHAISPRRIEVDKAKVDLISNLPPPRTVKEVRSFLGHAGFYRPFIQDFSKIARPLCKLLVK